MKIRINYNRILFALSMVALNEPLAMYYSKLHIFFSLGKYTALLYACYLLVKYIKTINYAIVFIIVYYLFLLYPTLLQGGDQRVWFRIFYMFVSTVIIIHVNMHIDAKYVINTLYTIVVLILLINLLYLGVYGADVVKGSYGGSGVRYLIGIRTRIGEWAYFGIMIGFVCQYIEPKKINIRFIILIISIVVFSIVNRVTTVILLMVIFLLIKALADRGVLRLNKSLNFILYGVIILNILIFEFQIQTYLII